MSDQMISGRYNLLKRLCIYPERTIYLAEDSLRFNELCIIQEYSFYDQELEQSAQILCRIKHPQIAAFRDIFAVTTEDREYVYLAEDYVEGPNYQELASLCPDGISEQEALDLLKRVLWVLDVLHRKGIVRGNLVPSSIVEDNERKVPVLVNFSDRTRYAPNALFEDIVDLSGIIGLFLNPDHKFSPQLVELLQAMERGDFDSANSVLEAIENFNSFVAHPKTKDSPDRQDHTPPKSTKRTKKKSSIFNDDKSSQTIVYPRQRKIASIIKYAARTLLVLGLSASAGVLGWLGGKSWLSGKTSSPQVTNTSNTSKLNRPVSPTPSTSSTISSPSVSPTTLSANTSDIQQKLLALNLSDNNFFNSLVDQIYYTRYPQARNIVKNAKTQQQWNQVANELLDYLQNIKPEAVSNLGKYTSADLSSWASIVNKLHLSSKSVYQLADSQLSHWFPQDLQQPITNNQPLGQLRDALIYSQVLALQGGENYQKLAYSKSSVSGVLESGMGRAYSIYLTKGKLLKISLESSANIQLFIYTPTYKNLVSEKSSVNGWSGALPESGYYEIIVIPQSITSTKYTLKLE